MVIAFWLRLYTLQFTSYKVYSDKKRYFCGSVLSKLVPVAVPVKDSMKGTIIKTVTAIVAGALSTLIGGWDMILEILLIVMTLDYITGVVSAFKQKTVSSNKGYMGLVKKGGIFVIIILAAQMDRMTGNDNHIFRNCTALFFVANDALSVLENVGELGIELPAFLRSALIKLREAHENPSELSGHNITSQRSSEDTKDNTDSIPDDKR